MALSECSRLRESASASYNEEIAKVQAEAAGAREAAERRHGEEMRAARAREEDAARVATEKATALSAQVEELRGRVLSLGAFL